MRVMTITILLALCALMIVAHGGVSVEADTGSNCQPSAEGRSGDPFLNIDFGGAVISHTVVGDTLAQTLPAVTCALLLALSYWAYRARPQDASTSAAD